MILILLFLFLPETILTRSVKCGGEFSATKGVLSTPNFPKKFDVPIHCEWVINIWDHPENSSIIVYLTQMYVFEGLTFTEYELYGAGFQVNGREILTITEDNVSNSRYVQCHANYLVITLKLSSIESTHLRVLDGLLDVYGFNITYEITRGSVRKDLCTMASCGFTGNCYDHYTYFSCDCFPGYTGKQCSEGLNSLCYKDKHPVCKNGGVCRHVGDSAVTCNCKPGFVGTHCEIPKPNHNSVCEDCFMSCPFDQTLENVCKCPKTRKTPPVNDSIGFSSTVFISNITTDLTEKEVRSVLGKYITKLLRSSFPKVDEVLVSYLQPQSYGTGISFHFYAPKKDERRIRALILKWAQTGAIGNYSLIEKEIIITTDPYLHLQSVSVNRENILEKEEFILSCVARGSRNMIFRWFKDGNLIKIGPAVRTKKWSRLIGEGENKDHYTALLGVNKATVWDEGVFTCQVEDYGIQQCRTRTIILKHPPIVYLDPISLTVNKGEPFLIKCLSEPHQTDKYIYSWTKDKILLPTKTESEHYEVLYPTGSILQVSGLNVSATYSCLVQNGKLSSEKNVSVNVVDRSIVMPCPPEFFANYTWPFTATGNDYLHKCPKNYGGFISRSCIILENGQPKWQPPDYSKCSSVELDNIFKNFLILMEGYEITTPLETLNNIAKYVNNASLLHGEGNVVLELLTRITEFNNKSNHSNSESVSVKVFEIIDDILSQLYSLNKEQQVLKLQKLMKSQLMAIGIPSFQPFQINLENLIVKIEVFEGSTRTLPQFTNGNLIRNSSIARVIYKNLSKFISKSIIRLSDDREIDYEIVSSITGVWILNENEDPTFNDKYNGLFIHSVVNDSPDWDLRCALADYASSNYVWDTNVCSTMSINSTATICNCTKQGTMALLLVEEPKAARHESPHPYDIIILIGCSTCLVLSSLCGVLLLCNWLYHRSSFIFLKLQCSISITGAMTVFVIAFCNELPKESYLYILSILEIFFFTSMSSQLSTLLIVYSELVEIQRKESIKQTVVGIITGAPLIVVFGNYIAHRTMDIHLSYWWLLKGTLSFNVFSSCSFIILILFIVLYFLVLKMLRSNKSSGSRFLNNRSRLIKKTSLTFFTVITMAAFSITCINLLHDPIWHYIFSSSCIFTGFVLLSCLIFKPQFFTKENFFEKFHLHSKSTETSSPKVDKANHSLEDSDNGANLHLSISNNSDLPSIQQYNSSPTQYNFVSKSNSLNSPDILGTKSFAQFDLVASSLQSASQMPISPIETEEKSKISVSISKAFEEPIKIANETVCEKSVTFCDTVQYETKLSSEHLDAVMDSISNDLNYLLNGHVELNDKVHTSQSKTVEVYEDNGIPC